VLAVVQVKPPGDAVARYEVIVAPPFDAGAVHETGTCVFWPLVAVTPVGVPGVVYGVAVSVFEGADVPVAFVAATRKSYELPLVSPVTDIVVLVDTACGNVLHEPPDVSLYSMT
jgi:hypothetical protein